MAKKTLKAVQTKVDGKLHAQVREKMKQKGHNWSDILHAACAQYMTKRNMVQKTA